LSTGQASAAAQRNDAVHISHHRLPRDAPLAARPDRPQRGPVHPVQFYVQESVMLDQVASFLRPAIEAGEAGLVVATASHIDALRQRLGPVPCTFLDAEATLEAFMPSGRIDGALFEAVVGGAVREASRQGNGRVRAFGEMVALLCEQGRHGLALELEGLWNRLAGSIDLTLLCAYPFAVFGGPAGASTLAAVCALHDHATAEPGAPTATSASPVVLLRDPAAEEAELLDFVQNGPVGMHQVDGAGTILWANRFELELLGYSSDEFIGRNIKDFHAQRRVVDEIFQTIATGNVVLGRRSALRRKDGSFLPVLISSSGVLQDGVLVRSRCILRPIDDLVALETAQRQALKVLTLRERQQACVARIGHLALRPGPLDEFFAKVCGEITQAIGADSCALMECVPGDEVVFRSGLGYPLGFSARISAMPGTHAHYILRSGTPVVYEDLLQETRFTPAPHLVQNGVRSGMSVPVHTAAGPWGTVGVHGFTLRTFTQDDVNFLEAVAHVLGAAIERRKGEEELKRTHDLLEGLVRERTQGLERANRELEAFSSAVSHDLRGPVRAISGFSALIAQRHAGNLDVTGRELLTEVQRAAARMGDLIEDLLDLSRADRTLPSRGIVDVSAMATEILRAEGARTPDRHVRCDVEPDLVVHGDAGLLHMALENLLSNAWKFTAKTQDARISVSKRRQGEEVVLCVQDNGAGFDMADAGRLFQPFQRLHSRSEYDGTGIGLATVRRIIERHGGRIWAQSKPNAGASFYFTLPGSGEGRSERLPAP
jgi:PAS domain S-box-containing protein